MAWALRMGGNYPPNTQWVHAALTQKVASYVDLVSVSFWMKNSNSYCIKFIVALPPQTLNDEYGLHM